MYRSININCDLGEIDPSFKLEEEILPYVSMCNIACGGHAGNDHSIESVMKLANSNNVLIGLHPSYKDAKNFGRLTPEISKEKLRQDLKEQLDRGFSIANSLGLKVNHIKAHGALYHDVSKSEKLSELLLVLLETYSKDTKIMGLPNTKLQLSAEQNNIAYIKEGFGDRAYNLDGSLVKRNISGSVLSDIDQITKQALELHNFKGVETIDGQTIDLEIDSICYHSDAPQAVENLKELHFRLKQVGIEVYKFFG